MKAVFAALPIAFCVACGGNTDQDTHNAVETANISTQRESTVEESGLNGVSPPSDTGRKEAPLNPPAPGEPGGLPDDRTPVAEGPFAPGSTQGAANVVQTYYALLEQGKYGEAWKLWSDGGKASGMSADAFAASFAKYREYHANIGAPGRLEGAAGSLYVDVPVQVYGRLKSGEPFNMLGPVTLRRANDVPGSTDEQRRWHITASGVRPRP